MLNPMVFPLFLKTGQIFSGLQLLMSTNELDETYIFEIIIKV